MKKKYKHLLLWQSYFFINFQSISSKLQLSVMYWVYVKGKIIYPILKHLRQNVFAIHAITSISFLFLFIPCQSKQKFSKAYEVNMLAWHTHTDFIGAKIPKKSPNATWLAEK